MPNAPPRTSSKSSAAAPLLGTKDVGIMRVRLSPVIGLRICRAIGGHPRTSSVFLSSKKDFYKVTHGGLELSLQSGQASSFLASCLRPPSSWHVRLMLPGLAWAWHSQYIR